jgi:hypothetical protein
MGVSSSFPADFRVLAQADISALLVTNSGNNILDGMAMKSDNENAVTGQHELESNTRRNLVPAPRKPLDFLQVAEERREGPDEIGVDSGPKRLGCGVKPREGEEMYFPELLNVDQLKNEVAYCAGAYEALHRVDLLDVSAEMRNSDE